MALWFHGSSDWFEQFDAAAHREEVNDWNVFLGIHFAADVQLARSFCGRAGMLVSAQLQLANPHAAGCELEQMTPAAVAAALGTGTITPGQLADALNNDVVAGPDERRQMQQLAARLADPTTLAQLDAEELSLLSWAAGIDTTLAQTIAASYRQHLQTQGYDGVIYENAFEGGGRCAVPFSLVQITIIDRRPAQSGLVLSAADSR